MITGMISKPPEGRAHVDTNCLTNFPLNLFDSDPAVQRARQLVVEGLGINDDFVLHDGDRRDVGEGLGGRDLGFGEGFNLRAEHVEGTESATSYSHR